MATITLPKPHGFRLDAAADFYRSFVPGCGMAAASTEGHLTLAFRLDGTFEPAALALREGPDSLSAEYAGTEDADRLSRQVTRMLGLDADGDAWGAIGRRDPGVGRLQEAFPGFFTAAKASPYDAATWAILAPRMGIAAAARLKSAMAERLGDRVTLGGRVHHLFPAPGRLADLESFPGLSDEKRERLRGVGEAAALGQLEAEHLLTLGEGAALAELMRLRGVGPWAASHIYFRGAAPQDGLPTNEPRVLHGVATAYGRDTLSAPEFERLAEGWRPFRMWVCVLASRFLAREGGWRSPRLRGERAAAGKQLARRVAG